MPISYPPFEITWAQFDDLVLRAENAQANWRLLMRHLQRQAQVRRLWGLLGNVIKRYKALPLR